MYMSVKKKGKRKKTERKGKIIRAYGKYLPGHRLHVLVI